MLNRRWTGAERAAFVLICEGKPHDTPFPARPPNAWRLWSLLFGNFVVGTGVLLPAGLLNVLAADLQVPPTTAGLLLFAGGLVVGIGAPVLAGLTSRFDRRVLLAVTAAIYAVGHGLAALAPEFWSLLIIRTVTMVAAALFTPQAAATVGLLVPPERRSEAIAFIFIGWSLASVVGIPLGSILGAEFGWRATFFAMAILSAVSCVGVLLSLTRGMRVQPLQFSSWVAVFKNPILLCIMAVTLLSMSGQFTVVSYLAPILRDAFAATPQQHCVDVWHIRDCGRFGKLSGDKGHRQVWG